MKRSMAMNFTRRAEREKRERQKAFPKQPKEIKREAIAQPKESGVVNAIKKAIGKVSKKRR